MQPKKCRHRVYTCRLATGAYVFWEFATDSYDIGFGVYFEWTDAGTENQVSVQVGESSDDETDEGLMIFLFWLLLFRDRPVLC